MSHKTAAPTLSIIIPVYNGGAAFRRCMSSLTWATQFAEVIVVDDGSTDESWRAAKAIGCHVIRLPATVGPARARNIGASAATSDLLFFTDADVEISPNAIKQITEVFHSDPELAALIGSYDDAPAASNFLSQYRNLFHHYTHQTASTVASTFWGACGTIRRDVFWALEGFDEAYRYPSVEDIELGYRLKRSGYRIRLHKQLQVKHLKRWEVVSLLKADLFYRALPWTQLLWRDRRFINDLNLQTSSRISVICAYGLLTCLAVALWWSAALSVAIGFGCLLFLLNFSVYQFFYQKRGVWFALRTIPWHWLYFLYSGLGFAIGTADYHLHQISKLRTSSLNHSLNS